MKTECKIDTQNLEGRRKLFGVKLPFLPKVISQEPADEKQDVDVRNRVKLIVAKKDEIPTLPQNVDVQNRDEEFVANRA